MDSFIPPIKDRSTDELLEILGAPERWNPEAVRQASNELVNRKVPSRKIETAKYLAKKRDRLEEQKKANKGYNLGDFIFSPFLTLFEILFAWELKKDGYLRKARQQKRFRITLLLFLLGWFLYSYFQIKPKG